jgi:hypothetical protein
MTKSILRAGRLGNKRIVALAGPRQLFGHAFGQPQPLILRDGALHPLDAVAKFRLCRDVFGRFLRILEILQDLHEQHIE